MNGVRRFLAGGGLSDPQNPGPPPPLDLGSPPSSGVPLTSASSDASSSISALSILKSPQPATAALFLKKKDKQRPPPANNNSVDEGRGSLARSSTLGSSSSSLAGGSRGSGPVQRSTRDELLLSLLASEAVVESRDFAILSSDEVDELKKEESQLASRLSALERRLETERKIRDAATTLSSLYAKPGSNAGNEQLDAANKRYDETQKEVWRVSQAKSDVSRRLVEHRAGVLSESVRRIEEKEQESRSRSATPNPMSPVSSTFNNFFAGHPSSAVPTSASTAQQQISQLEEQLRAATASLSEVSKKQADATRELNMLKLEKEQVEMMLGLDVQAANDKAEDVPKLEAELETLRWEKDQWEQERESRDVEKSMLQKDIEDLKWERERWGEERRVLEDVQQAKGGIDALLADTRRQLDAREDELREMQSQISQSQSQLSQTQIQLSQLERSHAEATEELNSGRAVIQTLVQTHSIVLFTRDSSLKGFLGAIGTHIESLSSQLLSTEQKLSSTENKFSSTDSRFKEQQAQMVEQVVAAKDVELRQKEVEVREKTLEFRQREAQWEAQRQRLEEDLKDLRESRMRDSAPISPTRNGQHFAFPPPASLTSTPPLSFSSTLPGTPTSISTPVSLPPDIEYTSPEALSIISALKPLWAVIPSPEARAAKFASSRDRAFRTASGPSSPVQSNVAPSTSGGTPKSISDLDVRSLKSLYDSTSKSPTLPSSNPKDSDFTLSSFIARIQALLTDDRLLIERLLRFAQAHDLLKKNAERAQKLASDSNVALETYQRQVRTLEQRNGDLVRRCNELQNENAELQGVQDLLDRISTAKSDIEVQAAEQAETCRQLTEANNMLSARALTLAEEAAEAGDIVRRGMQKEVDQLKAQLEVAQRAGGAGSGGASSAELSSLQGELDKARKELKNALDSMEAMSSSSQAQNAMLMEELIVTQTENAELKEKLRMKK